MAATHSIAAARVAATHGNAAADGLAAAHTTPAAYAAAAPREVGAAQRTVGSFLGYDQAAPESILPFARARGAEYVRV